MNADGSSEEEVSCHFPFAVVQCPYCILGVDQLSATRTSSTFSPTKGKGDLSDDF